MDTTTVETRVTWSHDHGALSPTLMSVTEKNIVIYLSVVSLPFVTSIQTYHLKRDIDLT